jgi:hypothetical protein
MSELEAFEAKVNQNIKLLSSPNAKVRRKAAAWLGEAGDPIAITRLKQVYESDPDAGVRQTAAYSLGMFKVLEQRMDGPDSERVLEMLEDVQLRGKMGRRTRYSTGCLTRLIVGLLVSLAILLAFTFVVWPQYEDQIRDVLGVEAPAKSDNADTVAPESAAGTPGALLAAIRADATLLQTQYTNPEALDCQAEFANPIAYNVADGSADSALAEVGARLNVQLVQLVTAKAPYNQACSSGTPTLTAEQVAVPLATIETILAELAAVEADMSTTEG